MTHDVKTVAGRRVLDEVVQGVLPAKMTTSRTQVAQMLGLDTPNGRRAVSASLKRGLRDGWAAVEGRGAWQRYRRTR